VKNSHKGIPLRKGKEIDGLRISGQVAAEVLAKAAALIKPGVSTLEIDKAAAQFMADLGSRSAFLGYRGFPGHICISINSEVVHGIGRANRFIANGDVVKIDVGIIKDGWVGDNATTVPVGAVRPEVYQLLRVTEESLLNAITYARPGSMLRDLCASIETLVTRFGYSVVRNFVGHGVGRKLHEKPEVPNYYHKDVKTRLQPGMVLAIEPMINLGVPDVNILSTDNWTAVTADGKASAHFEHMIIVTEDEPEILTARPRLTPPIG
jgi:methionyl aminopeptidase